MEAQTAEEGPDPALAVADEGPDPALALTRTQTAEEGPDPALAFARIFSSVLASKSKDREQFRRIYEFFKDRSALATLSELLEARPGQPSFWEFMTILHVRQHSEMLLRRIFGFSDELESFEEFMSNLSSLLRETAILPEVESFAEFMSDLRNRQSETALPPEYGSLDEFMLDLDSLEDEFLAIFHRYQGESLYRSDIDWVGDTIHDINSLEDPTFDRGDGEDETLVHPEFGSQELLTSSVDRQKRARRVKNPLASLPAVNTATLSEGDQSCPICLDKYDSNTSTTASAENSDVEHAIRLRCNHLLGKSCFKKWLEERKNTCPFCRTNVFV
ncbi:hypothetical protein MMC07_007025 [Pseudocyphellaria aurata]|nr:hypothetical protein [Pseudocyphellaria aurata]